MGGRPRTVLFTFIGGQSATKEMGAKEAKHESHASQQAIRPFQVKREVGPLLMGCSFNCRSQVSEGANRKIWVLGCCWRPTAPRRRVVRHSRRAASIIFSPQMRWHKDNCCRSPF